MNKIGAYPRTVRDLLSGKKYSIADYYQREYKWRTENIGELLQDLVGVFMQSYREEHNRKKDGRGYDRYFLGSIIINVRDNERYIIDGQQRLTSLTLLLIYLNRLQKDRDGWVEDLPNMIRATNRGESSYNIDGDDYERTEVLNALYNDQPYDPTGKSESVRNIHDRYEDIQKLFPPLTEKQLLFFIDWLLDNVDLVEITTDSEDEAYRIFETMNDRGMSLTPTEMLKGYMLSKVVEINRRQKATEIWRKRIEELARLEQEGRGEDVNFFKAWLRAKYAIRPREPNTRNDFEYIGSAFNKWLYEKREREDIGLSDSDDFYHFVERLFTTYSSHYLSIRHAEKEFTPGLEYIYYNAYCRFSLQPMLILAPIKPDDKPDIVKRKMRLVSGYIDIFIARYIWNYRNYDYTKIHNLMFQLTPEIRDRNLEELAHILRQRLDALDVSFGYSPLFGLTMNNGPRVHYMLARITCHIEEQCDLPTSFTAYVDRRSRRPYQIEHIWANNFERHRHEFEQRTDFDRYRNMIGGLVLLQSGKNQAYGDMPYEEKVRHYQGENLLASSLAEITYKPNPAFESYCRRSGLPFQHYANFTRQAIEERQELYRRIAEEIWSPARFDRELQ